MRRRRLGESANAAQAAFWAALFCVCVSPAFGQDRPAPDPQVVPLTVPAGVPLDAILSKPVPIKQAGVPVEARVVEPLYVFDHLVIPAGSQLLGRVTQVQPVSRKQRALAIANGDFTPLRTAQVTFDTLVLKDGKRLPVQTTVSQGAPRVVHLSAQGPGEKKKSRVHEAAAQARDAAKSHEHQAIQEIKAPGKKERLKALLIAQLPYHKQQFPAGTQFTAELKAPLELGKEDRPPEQAEAFGAPVPPGATVRVRLLTALSSAKDHRGSPVRAVVSEPVFSADHRLILPEGAQLEGSVTRAVPARRLGRNGQLRFVFHRIDLGPGAPRKVEASLQGVDAASGAHLKLDSEGGAHATTPKTNYIAPTIQVLLATSSLDGLHEHDRVPDPGGEEGAGAGGATVRGGSGFGLLGAAIGLIARYRPLTAGFAVYGAGRSVYSHVVARGHDVSFQKNTPMEIRFGTHESPAKSQPQAASGASSPAADTQPAGQPALAAPNRTH